jgi:hypothetical protein
VAGALLVHVVVAVVVAVAVDVARRGERWRKGEGGWREDEVEVTRAGVAAAAVATAAAGGTRSAAPHAVATAHDNKVRALGLAVGVPFAIRRKCVAPGLGLSMRVGMGMGMGMGIGMGMSQTGRAPP